MVRTTDGRTLGVQGIVSFTGIRPTAEGLVFSDVRALGGEVTARRLVVPTRGFSGARVEGLTVDGVPRAAVPNGIYPLRRGGYVVVLQEAVAQRHQGLVGLRIHTARALGAGRAGGDVLIGQTGSRSDGGALAVLALPSAPAPSPASGLEYPLAIRGVVIGCPFVPGSTHSPTAPPDNLASDNAVDLAVPVGTPVLAVADGTVGALIGPLDSHDPHLAGLRVHLNTPAERFYYAHLSRIDVVPGQHVAKGQQLGLSGAAVGVAHLHFAEELGDPAEAIGETGACPRLARPDEPWG
jgi:hypothetical protein